MSSKELSETKKQAVVARLMGNRSCAGCEYLYFHDIGYSNYTVTETAVHCAGSEPESQR